MPKSPPLKGYWPTVAFVLLALAPDLILSTALPLLRPEITQALHTSRPTLALASTFSNAGWAFGAVLAGDFAQRFYRKPLLFLYEGAFVVGSSIAAAAPGVELVIAGHIVQGMATGMLLVAALPPLITTFPKERLKSTAAVIAIGLFGAVAAGPLVGGYVALTHTWRWLFAAVALLGVLGFLLISLAIDDQKGHNPTLRFDAPAIVLAAAGAGLTFYGVGELNSFPWTAPIVWLPTALGLGATVAVVGLEYRVREPLMPVKPLATTIPVIGITSAIMAGAAFTGLLELVQLFMQHVQRLQPLDIGLLLWPDLAVAVVASIIFGLIFTTRYVLLLPAAGLLALVVAAALLGTTGQRTGTGEVLWIAALLGAGAGLTVSPGLFIAGLSVSSKLVGRAFALVEMLRLAGAYALVPAFVQFAQIRGTQPPLLLPDLHLVCWVILGMVALTLAGCLLLWAISGARLQPPDLQAYLEEGKEALDSPRLAEQVRA